MASVPGNFGRFGQFPTVASNNLTESRHKNKSIDKLRKQSLLNRDRTLVDQWRALKTLGVYQTKDNPSLDRLTKSRREAIRKKFSEVQNLARYENGETFRPLHLVTKPKTVVITDDLGRTKKKYRRTSFSYKLDADHFQLVKNKKAKIPNALKTSKGLLVPKAPNEKIRITKNGKVQRIQETASAKTVFENAPLSGAVEFIALMEDIRAGKIKLRPDERLALSSNGRKPVFYAQKDLKFLADKLERYSKEGYLIRADGTPGNFDDWANNAEIVKIYKR